MRRGTPENPANRYERLHVEPDPEEAAVADQTPTQFFVDSSRTILAENDSPDIGFRFSLNPYRGCEHGCVYCYARPTHEYLGFSAGLDFESRILVKTDAPELLRNKLSSPGWRPELISLSGNTDCYQPAEGRLCITRGCLEVLLEFRNPVGIVTKNALVLRDLDLLTALAEHDLVRVMVSVTSLDADLVARLEPRTARPELRLGVVARLAEAGIPVGVLVAPVIPGLNDHEIPKILDRAAATGAQTASWILLRLPRPVDELLHAWLERHYPSRAEKVLARIRECRGGRFSDNRFGTRMRGEGDYADNLAALFRTSARKHGLDRVLPPASTAAFRRPQGSLF